MSNQINCFWEPSKVALTFSTGHASAAYNMGLRYYDRTADDKAKAVEMFQKAVDAGHGAAAVRRSFF